MMPDLIGQQFGNYRLVRLLGTGGFASVYLGQHVRIASQQAAIKILHLFGVDVQAFQQEAETTASLDHPHIVRLLDFDLHQGSMPFLIMGYAAQGSLRNRHPKGTPLPLSTVIQYTKEIASALQYAHDNNIIHRDIKPENILIGRRNELLLSDFGISVLSKTGRTSLEHGYNIGGTAEYMAPEMFRGKPEKASDQYALGVVVYEWLSGTPPFTEGNPIQLGFQHTHEEVPPLRKKLPSLASPLEAAVIRALAKDPKDRFPSIQTFANALEEASQAALPQATPPKVLEHPMTMRDDPYYYQDDPQAAPSRVLQRPKSTPPIGTRLLTFQGHTNAVIAVAWSPDSTRLASGSHDKTIQIWDASNDRLFRTCTGHSGDVNAVIWSPDGTRLASGSGDKTIQIWDANSGRLVLTTYTGHSGGVTWVAWSPDGKRIASSSYDKTVQVWDAKSGRLLYKYTRHSDAVYAVAWSPDSTRLASCSGDKTVQVWNANNGQLLYKYISHSATVVGVAWSPDSTRLASCSADRTVEVWNANNGRLLYKYTGHTNYVYKVTWSPDGTYLVSSSGDKTVQVWDASSGRQLYTYTGHTDKVIGVMWSPDGTRIASASWDKTVQIWQAV